MTDEPLDSILSGAGASAPVSDAPRVDEPEHLISDPVVNDIGTDQVEGEPHPDENPAKDKIGGAFKAQREGQAKRYTEQVADFEKRLSENDARWEQRFTQLLQRMPAAQPQAKPEAPVTDPVDALLTNPQQAIAGHLTPLLAPIQQQMQGMAQLFAGQVHGADKVKEAETAFLSAYQSGQLDPADYSKVVDSPNRWDAAVQWHKRQTAQAEIGDDPAAYRERVKAEILADIQKTGRLPDSAQQSAAMSPGVMPSNLADARNAGSRGGPAWTGPPSIDEALAAGRATIFK